MMYGSLYERLVANTEVVGECWVWTGNTDSKGYGRVSVRVPGKKNPTGRRAHRVMFEEMRRLDAQRQLDDLEPDLHIYMPDGFDVVPLDPDDETIEHKCLNTSCINFDHLIVLTRAENTRLMNERRALNGC